MDRYLKNSKSWLPVALMVVFFMLFYSFVKGILVKLNIVDAPDESAYKKQIEDGRIQIVDGAKKSVEEQYKAQASTKSDAEWLQIAEIIYNDLNTKLWQEQDDAVYQVCRVKNDTDVFKLIAAYGTRPQYVFGIPYRHMTLGQIINYEFTAKQKAAVNDNYARKGIKFRW